MTPIDVPPLDPGREQALLDAFDAHWARRRSSLPAWVWRTAAGLALVSAGLNWLAFVQPPRVGTVETDQTGFVSWPGSEALPAFESGSLVRVNLPVTTLPALGLAAPDGEAAVVPADIVVGQDGLARAVRLVQR